MTNADSREAELSHRREDRKTATASRRAVFEQVWHESQVRRSRWQKILWRFAAIVRGKIRMSTRRATSR